MRFKQTTGAEAAAKLIENGKNGSARWAENAAAAAAFAKQRALASKEKWKNGVQSAIARDGFARGIYNSDPAATAATIAALGSSVHSAGLDARAPKIQAKFGKLMTEINAVAQRVNALPGDTFDQRMTRMVENAKGMAAIKGKV